MSVVSAAHGVLGPLLGKLAGKFGRLRAVRKDIVSLQSELSSMHAALQEYTMLEDPGVQVKTWISLLRELTYDTEDCIDKFIRHLGKGRHDGFFMDLFRKTALSLKMLNDRSKIADQIAELKARIKHVKELKDSYKLGEASKTWHAAVDPRLSSMFANEAHLVGVEGPRDDLVKWILEEGKTDCRVLSIVGFGGLGKTMLANEVLRKTTGHFDCRAFVSVSQKPVIRKIIRDMICKLPCPDGFRKDIDIWDEATSIAKLRELLQDKRYIVIIDDVWCTQAWNTIKCAFPENNYSSRIITTTRIMDVARSCCPSGDDRVYEMEALSDLHSKELFLKRIFGSEEQCPDMLKEVSNVILKKCGGLPLAIISISSLLANQRDDKGKWEKIAKSIGSVLQDTKSLEGILCLSYNDLAPNLKTCLLYLSLFPEDHLIERNMLMRRWIAEGFISEERGLSKQEVAEKYFYELINKCMVQAVAEKYFYELINKCMVQAVDIGYDGKVRACRVHDIMLEILISKAAEDNFTTVVGGGQTSLGNHLGSIRRLSIQYLDEELASELASRDLSHVRTLVVLPSCCITHLPRLDKFEALRVLDLEGCVGIKDYNMKRIGKLFQLRYLSFRDTRISRVPTAIVRLGNLVTLDLWNTLVQKLPDRFSRLTRLEHLIGCSCTLPNGIGDIWNLRLLSGFVITSSTTDALEHLGNLTSLEELRVTLRAANCGDELSCEEKRCFEAFLSSLCKLGDKSQGCKLRSLDIEAFIAHLDFLDSWSPLPYSLQRFWAPNHDTLTKLPKWITPELTNLADLSIRLIELTEDGLVTLGKLQSLLRLEIWVSNKFFGIVQGIYFPNLKVFHFGFITEQAYVTFAEGSIRKLEVLRMPFSVSAAKANGFYSGFQHLTCLKQSEIWLDNNGATPSETMAAAAAIRKEAAANPNHPTVTIWCEPAEEEDNKEKCGDEEKSEEDGDIQED